jgi:hypothetical protein
MAIACYAGNLDIYALGTQCKKDEIYDKWTRAQSQPIEPVEVKSAPCQERIMVGDELEETGLDAPADRKSSRRSRRNLRRASGTGPLQDS